MYRSAQKSNVCLPPYPWDGGAGKDSISKKKCFFFYKLIKMFGSAQKVMFPNLHTYDDRVGMQVQLQWNFFARNCMKCHDLYRKVMLASYKPMRCGGGSSQLPKKYF